MLWEEFKREVFGNYFPDTEKRRLKEKFRKLRQGDRSVADYEQEFSHIIDCVPDVVKDDGDRAEWFLRGLRPWIYRQCNCFNSRLSPRFSVRRFGQSMEMPTCERNVSCWPDPKIRGGSDRAVVRGASRVPRDPRCDAPTSQGVTHPRTTPVLARLTLLTSWALPPPKMLKPG
uniref:Retrotransposon gag domain-containing protein n=1 Tax=Ananas comosus var. bracteatus TaxID=296719 RepID=A0A6V7NTD9_ANACO|nr:unnamed protein product [Ananas comosus var. bracteatus]